MSAGVAASGDGAAWLAEPSAAERVRRAGRAGADSAGVAVSGAGVVWLAEPSATERARRGGPEGRPGPD
ncbi:hypothetical protein VR44_40805, partial [Streptomyces katrae]